MSPRKKIEIEREEDAAAGSEGLEGLLEESEGTLAMSQEMQDALAEAEASADERAAERARPEPAGAEGEAQGEVEAELKQTQDRLVRLHADFENFRRRALKEKTEAHSYGHLNLVKDLLPTVDNLDRALDHARKSGGGDLESLLEGVELVRREFLAALAKHGVTPIEALGKPFDPALHEAMAQGPDASVAPNTVLQEFQTGYQLRDRLLRPSRVVVSVVPEGMVPAEEAKAPDESADKDREPEGAAD